MLRHQNIKELYNESSCSHNSDKDKKTTCERLSPGTTLGGCSFEGALQALSFFEGAVHMIHSPSTCSHVAHFFDKNVDQPLIFTTQMTTHDLIFGGESKLALSIDYVFKNFKPKVIFIYLTCVSSLIGEDVERIAQEKQAALGIAVIVVNAAGFMGGMPFGARIAGVTLMNHLMGQKEPLDASMYDINLIGFNVSPSEMNAYKQLLGKIGFHIRWIFGSTESIDNTLMAHTAKLNVLISAKPMVSLARKMQEEWGIPWVEVSFLGQHATSDAIRVIVEIFADGKLTRISEQYIAREEKMLNASLELCRNVLSGKVALLDLKGRQSWQFIPLLRELGVSIAATSIYQSTQDDVEKVFEFLKGQGSVIREPYNELIETIEDENVDILLCDYHHYHSAVETKIVFMEVGYIPQENFSGFDGMLTFAHQLIKTLHDPFFNVIFQKAPWE